MEGVQYYHTNKMGNESLKEGDKKDINEGHDQQDKTHEDKATVNEQPQSSENRTDAVLPISKANEEMAAEVRAGGEAGIAELGAAAAELERSLALYDEHGRLLEILGRGHKGPLLKLQHFPSADGFSGHWIPPYGTKSIASASGASNCAYDALACQADR